MRILIPAGALLAISILGACRESDAPTLPAEANQGQNPAPLNPALIAEGRTIFRFDTFGDETFWTDELRMHEVIRSAVDPLTALAVGLKVDAEALPPEIVAGITDGSIPLNSPATTVTLLKHDAVLGLKGTVEEVEGSDVLTRVGITCALCHSTVDNSFMDGIGKRLDGWPNRDLDVGRIVALSPEVPPEAKTVYNGWGPGKYDPRFNIDGLNTPLVMPPAFGLRHVKKETYTGDGPVSYWNAYVAITQMGGHGHFIDTRIGVEVNNPPDLVSSKLEPLRVYQFSLETPAPAPGSFDEVAADRGRKVFKGDGGCDKCHMGTTYTDINAGRLHSADEVGQSDAYALRTATRKYRTTPLRGLWNPPWLTGPYFHDGSAATLELVVQHYVDRFGLNLTPQQRSDLVEYLKSL